MPYGFVQSARSVSQNATSISATFPAPAVVGDALIAIALSDSMSGAGTFTDDNAADVWWNVIDGHGTGGKPGAQMQYVTVKPGGVNTITFHAPQAANLALIILEYQAPPRYKMGHRASRTAVGQGINTGPVLTAAEDDLVVAFAADLSQPVNTWVESLTFTERATQNLADGSLAVADFIAEDIDEYSCSFAGAGTTDNLLSGIAAFGFVLIIITCNSPGAGTVGVPFLQTLTAVNNVGAITWTLDSGSLPPGLALNAVTGTISGTPTNPGTFTPVFRATDTSHNSSTQECDITINGVAAVIAPVSVGGGNPVIKGGCRPFNHYDYCLLLEMAKWAKIESLPPCSVPKDLWGMLPWGTDYGSLPALAVPFKPIRSISTPATAAGDTVVANLIVPQGYDGLITGFFWRYNGLNFVEGSGDILWRIRINQRFVKDLSNVGFTLGSFQRPLPLTEGGQLLQSRQSVSIVVNVPNLSGTIQIGTSTISAGLVGFFWPKGKTAWQGT